MYIGGDPECFVVERGRKKTPVPAHTFYGSRDELKAASPWRESPGVFRDGYAIEFNFPPSHCRETVARCLISLIEGAQHKIGPKHGLLFSSALKVDHSEATSWPKDVIRGGCSPSMNAYEEMPPPPKDLTRLPFRAAGGHYHISWEKERGEFRQHVDGRWVRDAPREEVPIPLLVKLCDVFTGVPFTYIFQDRSEIFLRRTLYGVAGEYRVKNPQYFEYRVLGAEAWSRIPFFSLFAGIVREIIRHRFRLADSWKDSWEDDIREAINTGKGLKSVASGVSVPHFFDIDVLERLRAYAKYCNARFPYMNPRQSQFYGFDSLSGNLKGMPPRPSASTWKLFGKIAA